MIFLGFFKFIIFLFLKLVSLILFVLNIVIIFIAGLGAITAQIGKLLLLVSAFIMIANTLPYFFSLPEKTFRDVWENILLFIALPLPFLFLTNIFTLLSKSITKLDSKLYVATEFFSRPVKGSKKYYAEDRKFYNRLMNDIKSQSKKG